MSSVIRTLVFIIPISYGCSSEKDFAGGTNSRIASKSEQQEDADSNDIDNIDDLNLACRVTLNQRKSLLATQITRRNVPGEKVIIPIEENGKMTARIVQEEIVTLPEGSIICAAKVKSTISSIRYDDHLVFTLNEYLIFSTVDAGAQNSKEGLPLYDWMDYRDKQLSNSKVCLGPCEIPESETRGAFSINIPDNKSRIIGLNLRNENSLKFKLITMGDDNPGSDCKHDPVDFEVEIDYIQTN